MNVERLAAIQFWDRTDLGFGAFIPSQFQTMLEYILWLNREECPFNKDETRWKETFRVASQVLQE